MKHIPRDIEKTLIAVSKEYSCVLISGPRQVGKSTLLEHLRTENPEFNRKKVSLDDLTERNLAKTDPAMFLKLHPAPVLIDEVQYAPELFSYIKIEIDNGAPSGSYWLTGSQVFKLMKLAQESLAGRTAVLNLTSLSQHEIFNSGELEPFSMNFELLAAKNEKSKKCDINEIYKRIFEGSLPGYISGKFTDRNIFYSSYLQTYISRDIAEDEESKNIDKVKFLDFIRAAACRISQILNIHSMADDVGVSDDTAKRWLYYLEKSGIVFFLHPYENNLLKRTIKTPKMYFFDTGLVAYLTRYTTPEILQSGALNGAIFENYAVCEIRKNFFNRGEDVPIYYFHDKEGNEADVVIEMNGVIHPIEIKKSQNPTLSMIDGFKELKKSSTPLSTGAVICGREELGALDGENFIIPVSMV